MKKIIQKIFCLRTDVSLSFYIADFLFRKILRQNAGTKWAVHFTSTIFCPQNITRGKSVYPGDSPNNYIEAQNGIIFGDFVNLGPAVGIISANHDLIDNTQHTPAPPIRIGNYCWIGMNAVILPGVQLGDFTIVAAGAVVSKSFPDGYCVLAGTPAEVIKQLNREACQNHANKQ
ncbi:MAG: acyltransferase [Ferruginibacter sp.]|nr:acyltransferase [Ferruginibacter sp.]